MSTKKSSLTYEPVSAWDSYATTTRRRQVNALAQRYIEFLSACKTERETIAYVQKRLAEAGFGEDFRKASVMRSLHGKCLFAVRKGRSTLASGVRLIAVVGGDELAQGVVRLRDMATHDEALVARDELVEEVRARL